MTDLPELKERNFYSSIIAETESKPEFPFFNKKDDSGNHQPLSDFVRESIIGKDVVFSGPFGPRKMTYCDYTASGRSLVCIEDYIREVVLPFYGNTHSTSSVAGHQSTLFRFESRQLIGRLVNARHDKDVVLFTGSGATGGIHHLIQILIKSMNIDSVNTVVFVGPYEHHSMLLPWRELGCKVVVIKELSDGNIDINHLEEELIKHASFDVKIGCFSAASNITGILTDTNTVTGLLHRHSALSFWDYATAGPYTTIDMNPAPANLSSNPHHFSKDAIFISPHKFVGGPGSSGILVVKKALFNKKRCPSVPGGGTVFFVTNHDHRYLSNLYEREEGGTPDIIGSIRAALVMKLKNTIGVQHIRSKEQNYCLRAEKFLSSIPNIHLLGPLMTVVSTVDKLPIFSFLISHPLAPQRFLHYNFVCALLNDLFGIQSRGGCMCAGPYGQHLLGIDFKLAKQFEEELVQHDNSEVLRPGFVRLNFNFFISEDEFNYILQSIQFVALHGWKFLPQYTFYEETNEWVHLKNRKFPDRKWLDSISFSGGNMTWDCPAAQSSPSHTECLNLAEELAASIREEDQRGTHQLLNDSAEKLRWFVYPHEAFSAGQSGQSSPFCPRKYEGTLNFPLGVTDGPIGLLPDSPEANSSVLQCIPCGSLNRDNQNTIDSDDNRNLSSNNSNSNGSKSNKEVAVSQYKTVKNKSLTSQRLRDQIMSNGDSENQKEDPPKKKFQQQKKVLTPEKIAMAEKKKLNKTIFSLTTEAITTFDMIKDGDKVLIGLSGGKDSLTLLNILMQIKQSKKWNFELGATTVDPQTLSYDPSPLIPYLKQLGVPYHYESQPLIDRAKDTCPTSICAWCSRMKRGIICQTAREHGYNKIALGQHLDDLAESFLMYAFHNGKLDTMKANSLLKDGDLSIIRPFIYVRELQTKKFAKLNSLPVITENCPACFAEPKERKRMKALLASQENVFPLLFNSLRSTLHPLMHGTVNVKKVYEMLKDGKLQELTQRLRLEGGKEEEELLF